MAEQKKKLKDVLQAIYNAVKALVVQPDYAQNDSTQPDFIKNRTHYVENVSTSSVWNQTGCSVGSGTTSPGGYPATFNITTGNKYNVTISQGSNSKTYEGLMAEYDSVFNGLALRKNWSDSMGMSDTSTDALLLVVQPSNVVLRSADIYGENCTVQVSEVTETVHKLDPKYLPDNVNQLDSITTSKSGKVTTVTFEQTNGTETQFQVNDGEDGKSAYQVAVDNGYSGTEAQWLASLKGADGVSLGDVELTQEVTTATDSVPANKAVYDKVQRLNEGDFEIENLDYTINERVLTYYGWTLNKKLNKNAETTLVGNCISPMFPLVFGHTYTFTYNFVADNSKTFNLYTSDGVYKGYYGCNSANSRTVTIDASSVSTATQMRGTFSLSDIESCSIHDDTTNEYIFKGDEYIAAKKAEYQATVEKIQDKVLNYEMGKKVIEHNLVDNYMSVYYYPDLDLTDEEAMMDALFEWDTKLTNQHTIVAATGFCVSPFIPVKPNHSITVTYKFNSDAGKAFWLFDENGEYLTYYGTNVNNDRTFTSERENLTQIRCTFNQNDLSNCCVYDNTDQKYLFIGTVSWIKKQIENARKALVSQDYFKKFYDTRKTIEKYIVGAVIPYAGYENHSANQFAKLNAHQVELLNASDTMSIFISQTVFQNLGHNGFYRRYHRYFYSVDTDGVKIGGSATNDIIVNGVTVGGGSYAYSVILEINRVEGVVKTYSGDGVLLATKTNSAFITPKFIGEDGKYRCSSHDSVGGLLGFISNFAIFTGEIISKVGEAGEFRTLQGYTPSYYYNQLYKKTDLITHQSFASVYTNTMDSLTYETGAAGTSSWVIGTIAPNSTKAGVLGANYSDRTTPEATYSVTPFDVISGSFTIPQNRSNMNSGKSFVYYRNQDGTKGAEISDYTNVTAGQYLHYSYPSFVGVSSGLYAQANKASEENDSIKMYTKTYYYYGCVCNVRCDLSYAGRLYDTVAEEEHLLYTDDTLMTEFKPRFVNFNTNYIGTYENNYFGGNTVSCAGYYEGKQYRHSNGNVYVYTVKDGAYVVKQINNS